MQHLNYGKILFGTRNRFGSFHLPSLYYRTLLELIESYSSLSLSKLETVSSMKIFQMLICTYACAIGRVRIIFSLVRWVRSGRCFSETRLLGVYILLTGPDPMDQDIRTTYTLNTLRIRTRIMVTIKKRAGVIPYSFSSSIALFHLCFLVVFIF